MNRLVRALLLGVRMAAAATAVRRIASVARAAPPVTARPYDAAGTVGHGDAGPSSTGRGTGVPTISVVVPARDEAGRIGPLLASIVGAPGVADVLVVDDESRDDTAVVAQAAGANVLTGTSPPEGWAGKAWALQQGIEAATSDWVVCLDADTRPDARLPSALVRRAVDDGLDLVTVGGSFDCPTAGSRWLHPAMLTTLVYRFGPPGVDTTADRTMANGQCMAVPRQRFLDGGGMSSVRSEVVEDIALARSMASDGRRVAFLDAGSLLTVQMFESFLDTWRGWGRSLALPGTERTPRQVLDLAVVVVAQALPLPRLLVRRGDILDVALLAIRVGTLVGTRSAYRRPDTAYWLSPLADLPAAAALALGISRGRRQTWRGRTYS